MGIIYVLTNKINGKQYVGQTIRPFNNRLQEHLYMANKEKPKTIITKAIKKYGIDSFNTETHDVMNCCLSDVEKVMIKTLNTKAPNGYNITDGGEGTYGFHHTEESKKKMSISKSGINCSKETRKKLAKASRGKVMLEETKRKISIAVSGDNCSKEVRAKMSIANKGKIVSEETKKKLTKSLCKYTYEITTPNGDIEIITNMRKYCRDNNLGQPSMYRTANGIQTNHKGYKARILNRIKKEN